MNECWRYVGWKEGRKKLEFNTFWHKCHFLTYSNMCEINKKKILEYTWKKPCSVKVSEIDIYQLFLQMRQATPRQMFSLLFSHVGPTNCNWQEQMNPAHGICLITYTLGVLAVHSSSSSVRCDCHRLHAVRRPML